MRTYVCPECGKEYPHKAPKKCLYCGCDANRFNFYGEKEDGDEELPIENVSMGVSDIECGKEIKKTISNIDESAVRTGGNIVFAFAVICAVIGFISGIIMLSHGGVIFVQTAITVFIVAILMILLGWITRAFIRLFANISERLSSIDNKLK